MTHSSMSAHAGMKKEGGKRKTLILKRGALKRETIHKEERLHEADLGAEEALTEVGIREVVSTRVADKRKETAHVPKRMPRKDRMPPPPAAAAV